MEHLDARLEIGTGGVGQLHVESMAFALRKQIHSYYVACYPLAPKDDFWVQRVSETKMMAISEDVVKYKQRMGVEPAALELPGAKATASREKPQGVKVEPEKGQPSGTRKLIPVKQEGQTPGKASSETKESQKPKEPTKTKESVEAEEAPEPAQASRPAERTSASARKVPPAEEEADGQREGARPPEDSAEKRLASLKVRPQDKSPLVSSPSDDEPDYRRTSEEEEPSSSYEEVTVEPLRLRSRSRKRDAGKGRPPEPAYPPYSRPGSRKRTDWTDEERRADNWNARQKKKARKKELGYGQEKGKSKGKRRNKTKDGKGKAHFQAYAVTCDQWVHVAGEGDGEDHWTISPDGQVVTYHHQSSRRGLYVPSDQDLESLGITQQKLTNRRVTTVFGKDNTLEFIDDWRSPGDVPEAVNLDWVGTTEFQLAPEEAVAQGPRAQDPVDVPRPQPLNANSRVADLKTRLKQLGAPVWGDKARLWARLQGYEARGKASRDLEAQLQLREEELNRDPALGRQPVELPVPSPPSEVERLLHELTHLPYAPWCEACVRGRGRDLPHFGLQVGDSGALDHARLRPTICFDWFDIAGSTEAGERAEGVTQALLVIDSETGYVAAIPTPSKGAEGYPHLTKMIVTFLKLMRHEKVVLKSDQEPAIRALIAEVKEAWPHRALVEESPLYSSQSNGRAERAIQTVRRLAASLRVAVELRLGIRIDSSHNAWSWLVRHAAWLHNRFHVKSNGKTCFEELYQSRYKNEVVAFGEAVLFMEPIPASRRRRQGRRKQKMDAAMEPGVWLGRAEDSDEHLVGTPQGVYRWRTVRRMLPDRQWSAELFLGMKGLPWDTAKGAVPRGPTPTEVKVRFALPLPEVVQQPDQSLLTVGPPEAEGQPTLGPALEPITEEFQQMPEAEIPESGTSLPAESSRPAVPGSTKRGGEEVAGQR